jgi:site-specific DNA-cytosine methylase
VIEVIAADLFCGAGGTSEGVIQIDVMTPRRGRRK